MELSIILVPMSIRKAGLRVPGVQPKPIGNSILIYYYFFFFQLISVFIFKSDSDGVHQKYYWGYCNEKCPVEISGIVKSQFKKLRFKKES